MIVEQPARIFRWLYPHALWRMDHGKREVYLTFDDGPIPEATPFILDALDSMGIKATFFMVADNALRYPQLFQEVCSRGHRIGNHTFHHVHGFMCGSSRYISDVQDAEKVLNSGKLFRPPRGWITPGICTRLNAEGWRIVMWDVVTRDYSNMLSPDQVLENVKRYTRNGSILTFHDSLKSIDKLRIMLPKALAWLKSQGYEFRVFD